MLLRGESAEAGGQFEELLFGGHGPILSNSSGYAALRTSGSSENVGLRMAAR
jgi:hypothetical protein